MATTVGVKPSQQFTTVDILRRQWRIADEAGFDGCWVFDHFAPMGPVRSGDVFEAWTLLAAMAEATKRVRMGCIVTGNVYRHPAVLAKMAVTVDHLSGGRLDMGLGAGGDAPVDQRMGLPERPARERIERLAEACRVLGALWSEAVPDVPGTYYCLRDAAALSLPKPVQRPRPPLWIGSSGERFGLRVVAEYADAWFSAALPGSGPEEVLRLSGVLDGHCRAVGRDPATLRRAVQFRMGATPDDTLRTAEAYVRAGFSDLVLMLGGRGADGLAQAAAAADLLPKLREVG
jgi:alkanesulfonate monooxygenase SsuD/methylene tetrahydromethanopterin reductase-like flavin-dependent oxidoreductase (luciferase family)